MLIRLHNVLPGSRANGPGLRAVIWFQGCTLNCLGCFNPATHARDAGYATDTADLYREIVACAKPVEGVSISGGEPFQQPEALLDLALRFRAASLSVLVFSGFDLDEIQRMPLGKEILQLTDVLIAGRFVQAHYMAHGLLGSSNQRIHVLTSRYTLEDFDNIPTREIIIQADGNVVATGIRPADLSRLASPPDKLP